MPRKRLPPRLWLEPERRNRKGELTHESTWIILDEGSKHRTGCGALDHAGAAAALERYLIRKHSDAPLPRSQAASAVLIADVIRHYLEVRGPHVAKPALLALRVDHLLAFWGEKTLDDIDSKSCGRYVQSRAPFEGGARRELEDLRTALNLAVADKLCRELVKVTLPKKPDPRSDYLERDAAAKLIWRAYRKKERQKIHRGPRKGEFVETRKRPTRHVARFILFALYTGTRSGRVWSASFEKEEGRPWIDVEGGVFYRTAPGETASRTKRAPSIRIPSRLLAHLRRWKDGGSRYLCEYRAGSACNPKKAFGALIDDVFGEESTIVRHSLRHTAATWLLQDARDPHAIAGYLGMRTDTLIKVYGHHHPDFQEDIGESFSKGRAGRRKSKAA